MRSTVMLVDDQPMFRHGICSLLHSSPSYEVVAQADSFEQMSSLIRQSHPDSVVIEIDTKAIDGVRAIETIREIAPEAKVIVLTLNTQRDVISSVMAAGATGYMLKSCPPDELLMALNVVTHGQTYLSPTVATILVGAYRAAARRGTPSSPFGSLTSREREVMTLLVDGNTTKQIAYKLNVSAKTIASHKDSIMNKVRTRSIALLTRYALNEGIVN